MISVIDSNKVKNKLKQIVGRRKNMSSKNKVKLVVFDQYHPYNFDSKIIIIKNKIILMINRKLKWSSAITGKHNKPKHLGPKRS